MRIMSHLVPKMFQLHCGFVIIMWIADIVLWGREVMLPKTQYVEGFHNAITTSKNGGSLCGPNGGRPRGGSIGSQAGCNLLSEGLHS